MKKSFSKKIYLSGIEQRIQPIVRGKAATIMLSKELGGVALSTITKGQTLQKLLIHTNGCTQYLLNLDSEFH